MSARRAALWVAPLLALTVHVPEASAQVDNRLAVGLSVTSRIASSSGAGGSADVGFELRLAHERPGWGPEVSFFSWFNTDVQQPVTGPGRPSELGQLRIRPIMAGWGYTWTRGRTTVTADVLGGFAFNSFDLSEAAANDLQARLGATGLQTSASNTFVVKPEAQMWYDLNDRFGIKVSGGYLVARPSVTIASSLGDDTRSVRADSFLITVGVVYSLF
jgi:hypothetical protein